jgi:hypothetical protein
VRAKPLNMPLTDKMDIAIRQARVDDAEAIVGVHIGSWRAAYQGRIPAQVLNALNVEQRTQQWNEWLRAPESKRRSAITA